LFVPKFAGEPPALRRNIQVLSFRRPWPRSGVGAPVESTGLRRPENLLVRSRKPPALHRNIQGVVIPKALSRGICFFLPVVGRNVSQNPSINSKAQRAAPGLNIVLVSPTNLMNALILGAPSNDCKPQSRDGRERSGFAIRKLQAGDNATVDERTTRDKFAIRFRSSSPEWESQKGEHMPVEEYECWVAVGLNVCTLRKSSTRSMGVDHTSLLY